MELSGNTVLITGGSEGIGFELAKALLPNNDVIVCGRNVEKLASAKQRLPGLLTEVCDVTDAGQRDTLIQHVLRTHPKLNILINNAGGRIPTDLLSGEGVEAALDYDIALNFVGPASLTGSFLAHLRAQPRAAVVNVTTGLVYLPKAAQTFYCAGKAALHSYTQSLRWVLRGSSVRVYEVFVALADTNFHKGSLPKTIEAMTAGEAARDTLNGLQRDKDEIFVGKSRLARWLAFVAPNKGMAILNR